MIDKNKLLEQVIKATIKKHKVSSKKKEFEIVESKSNKKINDTTLKKLNLLLSKLVNIDNNVVDGIRLAVLYAESRGRDINLNQIVKKIKSL